MSWSSALLLGCCFGICTGLAFHAVAHYLLGWELPVGSQLLVLGILWLIGGAVWGIWMRSWLSSNPRSPGAGHP